MTSITALLPAPRYPTPGPKMSIFTTNAVSMAKNDSVPKYGSRTDWKPTSQADFNDGGAYPEIHIAQYPRNMGKPGSVSSNAITLKMDASGSADYSLIATQGHAADRHVQTSYDSLIPLRERIDAGTVSLEKPGEEAEQSTTLATQAAFDKRLAANDKSGTKNKSDPQYIRYTANSMMGTEGGESQKIIKMVDLPQDPLEPPKFKHTKVPGRPASPPAPILRSPPRKLTAQDQKDWAIPSTVSNWKNQKGFTISLDKRMAADGRGLEDVKVNDNFAKFSEVLNQNEKTMRDDIGKRREMQQRVAERQAQEQEEKLRELARRARQEREVGDESKGKEKEADGEDDRGRSRERLRSVSRDGDSDRSLSRSLSASDRSYSRSRSPYESRSRGRSYSRSRSPESRFRGRSDSRSRSPGYELERAAKKRKTERLERKREAERDLRLSKMGTQQKIKQLAKENSRDISERVALGAAQPQKLAGEAQFDSRLFSKSGSLQRGFNEDQYYDKSLFSAQEAVQSIYRPSASGDSVAEDTIDRLETEKRFDVLGKAGKGFEGADGEERDGPVRFVRDEE
jgi:SNW domain-containing protein 1